MVIVILLVTPPVGMFPSSPTTSLLLSHYVLVSSSHLICLLKEHLVQINRGSIIGFFAFISINFLFLKTGIKVQYQEKIVISEIGFVRMLSIISTGL